MSGHGGFNARTLDWFMNDPVWFKVAMQTRLFLREHRPTQVRLGPVVAPNLIDLLAARLETPLARRERAHQIAS